MNRKSLMLTKAETIRPGDEFFGWMMLKRITKRRSEYRVVVAHALGAAYGWRLPKPDRTLAFNDFRTTNMDDALKMAEKFTDTLWSQSFEVITEPERFTVPVNAADPDGVYDLAYLLHTYIDGQGF